MAKNTTEIQSVDETTAPTLVAYVAAKKEEKSWKVQVAIGNKTIAQRLEDLRENALEEARKIGKKGKVGNATFTIKEFQGEWSYPQDDQMEFFQFEYDQLEAEMKKSLQDWQSKLEAANELLNSRKQQLIEEGLATQLEGKQQLEIKFDKD